MAKPDPLSECRKKLAEVDEAGKKLRQAAAGVFASVREIRNILSRFQEKQPFLNEKARKATEKAVWRKCLRLMRRAEWQQRYVMRYQKQLVNPLDELQRLLPSKERAFVESQNFHSIISSYGNGMIRFVSRRDGKLSEAVRGHSEEAPAFAEEVIADHLTPLEAGLSRIAAFMEKNEKVFLAAVQRENSITIDLRTVVPAGPFAPHIILLDASFAVEVEAERLRRGKAYYNFNFHGELQIPRRVLKEMTHIPRFAAKGITSRHFVNYLTGKLGAKLLSATPTPSEKDTILRLWETTPKGSRASGREQDKFKESGDMEIITYTLRTARRIPIMILSNDHDIIDVSRLLRDGLGRKRGNISVVSYGHMGLVQIV